MHGSHFFFCLEEYFTGKDAHALLEVFHSIAGWYQLPPGDAVDVADRDSHIVKLVELRSYLLELLVLVVM